MDGQTTYCDITALYVASRGNDRHEMTDQFARHEIAAQIPVAGLYCVSVTQYDQLSLSQRDIRNLLIVSKRSIAIYQVTQYRDTVFFHGS